MTLSNLAFPKFTFNLWATHTSLVSQKAHSQSNVKILTSFQFSLNSNYLSRHSKALGT
jgi:hypothetical protein